MVVSDNVRMVVIDVILIEFQNQVKNGKVGVPINFLKLSKPGFSGISLAVANVPVGLSDAEMIHINGKMEKRIKNTAITQRMMIPSLLCWVIERGFFCFWVDSDIFTNLLPHIGKPELDQCHYRNKDKDHD